MSVHTNTTEFSERSRNWGPINFLDFKIPGDLETNCMFTVPVGATVVTTTTGQRRTNTVKYSDCDLTYYTKSNNIYTWPSYFFYSKQQFPPNYKRLQTLDTFISDLDTNPTVHNGVGIKLSEISIPYEGPDFYVL
jgi:hypothetical protein